LFARNAPCSAESRHFPGFVVGDGVLELRQQRGVVKRHTHKGITNRYPVWERSVEYTYLMEIKCILLWKIPACRFGRLSGARLWRGISARSTGLPPMNSVA